MSKLLDFRAYWRGLGGKCRWYQKSPSRWVTVGAEVAHSTGGLWIVMVRGEYYGWGCCHQTVKSAMMAAEQVLKSLSPEDFTRAAGMPVINKYPRIRRRPIKRLWRMETKFRHSR